jgi:hypothetical protein
MPVRLSLGFCAALSAFASQAHQPLRTAAPSDGTASVERAVFASAAAAGCRSSPRASVVSQELHPGATLSHEGFLTAGSATEVWEVFACGKVKRYLVSFEHTHGVGVRPLWLKPLSR